MCLMLYVGTSRPLPLEASPDLSIEEVRADRRAVLQWFSQPEVRFVGAHGGCSCGFPSVIADVPIEWYDGMRLESNDRAADLRSVRALLDLLRRASAEGDRVELYPVADGEEAAPPKGRIDWRIEALDAERFFFNERYLHVAGA